MEAELDMNSNRLINLPAPVATTEPLRLGDLTVNLEEIASAVLPTKADIDLGNVVDQSAAMDNLGIPTISILNFANEVDRQAILDHTLNTDVSYAFQAAFDSLPSTGGKLYMAPGRYVTTQTLSFSGKAYSLVGDSINSVEWFASHLSDAISSVQTSVDQRIEISSFRFYPNSASGPTTSLANLSWPLVASYGYTNFVMKDVEIRHQGNNSPVNAYTAQYALKLRGAWQYSIDRVTYFGNPPTDSAGAGLFTTSAFIRIDNCFGGWLNRGCIILYAGVSTLQIGYCEGIYDDAQHIGCGYAFKTDPACPNGANGFTGIGFWFDGEYNCINGAILQRNAYLTTCGSATNINRWGDNGLDWIGVDLDSPLGFTLPSVYINGSPSAAHTSTGIRVRVVTGNGADVVVQDCRFSNFTTAVDFGVNTTRCTITDGTTSTGAFGPNNFINNGTNNAVSWRTGDGVGYLGSRNYRGSDGSIQTSVSNTVGATNYPILTSTVGLGGKITTNSGPLVLSAPINIVEVSNPESFLDIVTTTGASNEKRAGIGVTQATGDLDVFFFNDARNASNNVLKFARTGTTCDYINAGTTSFRINGTQVLGVRQTGWTADTGTGKRTANATYTGTAEATYTQATIQTLMNAVRDLSQTVKSLKDDAIAHGIIGT